jgi:hypothetical protein
MALTQLSWTGAAREAVSGTAISTPTKYIPTKSKFQNKTKYVYLSEERGTRDDNNNRTGTVRSATGEMSGSIYLDTFVYPLLAFMGGITSTQPSVGTAPTAYSHAMVLTDIPPSLTLFKGYDAAGYSFAYAVCSKLKVKFAADGKVLEYDASFESQYGVKISGGAFTAMVPTYSTNVAALAGYMPTIKLDTVASSIIEDFEMEFDQKITLFFSARGNRGFLKADFGARTAKGTFTARFDDATLTDAFDAEANHALNFEVDAQNLGGIIVESLIINVPVIVYDEMDWDTSKESVLVKAKFTAMPGATKNSLFTATVVNEVIAYTV